MARTTELKRYTVVADRWDEFLDVMRKIVVVRKRHGFRVLCAFADREQNKFTWAIDHPGDFEKAAQAYYADPAREALKIIADYNPDYEIRPVEPIDLEADPQRKE